MNDEDYQELLSRASSLMDERLASMPPTALPSNISIQGRTASYEPVSGTSSREYDLKSYVGDLQIDGSRIRVVPFGVYNAYSLETSDDYFMVPNIGGRSIFNENPPTLRRRSGGGAVYLESVFEVYLPPESESQDYSYFRARLRRCNLVERSLSDPYPIKKAEISVTVGDDGFEYAITDSEAKAYRLIGAYDAAGQVYNQTFINGTSWVAENYTLPDGRILPPYRPAATFAPIKFNITIND
jgi:hypothetical protein